MSFDAPFLAAIYYEGESYSAENYSIVFMDFSNYKKILTKFIQPNTVNNEDIYSDDVMICRSSDRVASCISNIKFSTKYNIFLGTEN